MKYLKLLAHNLFLFCTVFCLLLFSCKDDLSTIVESNLLSYRIDEISSPSVFQRTELDSFFVVSIKVEGAVIPEVFYTQLTSANSEKVLSSFELLDDGNVTETGDLIKNDLVYSTKILMSKNYLSASYVLSYFHRNGFYKRKIATIQFDYNNGSENIPPSISNLVAPDSLVVDQTTPFLITIDVSDSNGLGDVEQVYFTVQRPDGSSNNVKTFLVDDGNQSQSGDLKAGDGTYSKIIQIEPTNSKGEYIFTFNATDKLKAISNTILKVIKIL